jgi:hypothetical protein
MRAKNVELVPLLQRSHGVTIQVNEFNVRTVMKCAYVSVGLTCCNECDIDDRRGREKTLSGCGRS